MKQIKTIEFQNNVEYQSFQTTVDCSDNIFELNEDDPCLIDKIRSWQHGRLHPMGNYSFHNNPPKLDGQIGVPLIVDKILGIIYKSQTEDATNTYFETIT